MTRIGFATLVKHSQEAGIPAGLLSSEIIQRRFEPTKPGIHRKLDAFVNLN